MNDARPARTVTVEVRRRYRYPRLRLCYPGQAPGSLRLRWFTRPLPRARDPRPCYDASLALELLRNTGELPATRHDLLALNQEYRYALHALAAEALARTPAAQPGERQPDDGRG